MVFAIYVLIGGVVLIITNHSGEQISNIKFEYIEGILRKKELGPGEIFKKRLGKIGTGNDFRFTWDQENGKSCSARYTVYFYDQSTILHQNIKVLPDCESILMNGIYQRNPNPESA